MESNNLYPRYNATLSTQLQNIETLETPAFYSLQCFRKMGFSELVISMFDNSMYIKGPQKFSEDCTINRTTYTHISRILSLIHRCRYDSINHYLYQAILLSNIDCHRHVLAILYHGEKKLENPLSMYAWDMSIEKVQSSRWRKPADVNNKEKYLLSLYRS